MAKANLFKSFAALAATAASAAATVGVLMLTGLPAHAQQAAPARQERGNLIYVAAPGQTKNSEYNFYSLSLRVRLGL